MYALLPQSAIYHYPDFNRHIHNCSHSRAGYYSSEKCPRCIFLRSPLLCSVYRPSVVWGDALPAIPESSYECHIRKQSLLVNPTTQCDLEATDSYTATPNFSLSLVLYHKFTGSGTLPIRGPASITAWAICYDLCGRPWH